MKCVVTDYPETIDHQTQTEYLFAALSVSDRKHRECFIDLTAQIPGKAVCVPFCVNQFKFPRSRIESIMGTSFPWKKDAT